MKHVYSKGNQYAERDIEALDNYYMVHIDAMTVESLYSKSSVAAELAFRDKHIAQLENQWISVEDRLPDAGQWYLCWSRNQTQIIFLDTVEPIMWLQDGDYLENVTHWMPLPTPPKEAQR